SVTFVTIADPRDLGLVLGDPSKRPDTALNFLDLEIPRQNLPLCVEREWVQISRIRAQRVQAVRGVASGWSKELEITSARCLVSDARLYLHLELNKGGYVIVAANRALIEHPPLRATVHRPD